MPRWAQRQWLRDHRCSHEELGASLRGCICTSTSWVQGTNAEHVAAPAKRHPSGTATSHCHHRVPLGLHPSTCSTSTPSVAAPCLGEIFRAAVPRCSGTLPLGIYTYRGLQRCTAVLARSLLTNSEPTEQK